MAVSTIAKSDIRIKYKSYVVPQGSQYQRLEADDLDTGYSFLCWIYISTIGYVDYWNIEYPNRTITNAWALEGVLPSDRTIYAYYLEKRIV